MASIVWIVSSSLRPTRRFITSSRPASASNDHLSPFFTSGAGKGQSSPMTSRAFASPSFFTAFFLS